MVGEISLISLYLWVPLSVPFGSEPNGTYLSFLG